MSEKQVACAKCGAVAPPGASHCVRCGAPLAAQPPTQTQLAMTQPTQQQGVQCPACGQVRTQPGDFCGNCGARLASATAPAPSDATVAMVRCPRCGRMMPCNRPLCSICGAPLHLAAPSYATAPAAVGVTERPTSALLVAGLVSALPIVLLNLLIGSVTHSAIFPPVVFLAATLFWAVIGVLIGLRMGWHSPPDYDTGFITGLWVSAAGYAVAVLLASATVRQLASGPYATMFWSGCGVFLGASVAAVTGGVIGLIAVAVLRALAGAGGVGYSGITSARRVALLGVVGGLAIFLAVIVGLVVMLAGGPAPKATVYQVGETAKVGTVEWTVTEVSVIRQPGGSDFLLVGLKGNNLGDRLVLLNPANFVVRDAAGREYASAPEGQVLAQVRRGDTALIARGIEGKSEIQIWEPFLAPPDTKDLRLVIKGGLGGTGQVEIMLGEPREEAPPPPPTPEEAAPPIEGF